MPNASKSAANASLANASLKGLSLDGGGLDVRPVGKAASNGVGMPGPTPPDEGVAAVVGTAVGDPPVLLPDPARAAGNAAKLFAETEGLSVRIGAAFAAPGDGFTLSGRVCPPARGASDGVGTGTTGGGGAGVEAGARAGAGGGAEVAAPRAARHLRRESAPAPTSLALRLGLCQHLPLLLKFCASRRERGLFTFCIELRGRGGFLGVRHRALEH